MVTVVQKLNWPTISSKHVIGAHTRIVHDLGILGDDWDDFYSALKEEYGKDFTISAKFMPGEVSHDAAMVASAQGFMARRIPVIQDWYISRIRCSPLTLGELDELIEGS